MTVYELPQDLMGVGFASQQAEMLTDLFEGYGDSGVVYPEQFGARGDGVADDTEACQRWADYLNANGGIGVARGVYRLASYRDYGFGTLVSLCFWGDNISIDAQGATFLGDAQTANYRPVFVFGGGRLGLPVDESRPCDADAYAIGTTIAKYATSCTLATPADAANFPAGSWAYIRTGQCTQNVTPEPSAELIQVMANDPSTGVVTFDGPTTKAYAQEYYISGTTGRTSTTPTANPAPFTLANVTDRLMFNFQWIGGQIESNSSLQCLSLWSAVNARLDLKINHNENGFGSRDARTVSGTMLFEHNGDNSDSSYFWHPSTGCSDWDQTVVGYSAGHASLRMHEDVSRSRFRLTAICRGSNLVTTSNGLGIGIAGRATDIVLDTPYVDTGTSNTRALSIDPYCTGGGRILNPTFVNAADPATVNSVVIDPPNWWMTGERMLGSNTKVSLRALQSSAGHTQGERTLEFGLTSSKTSCTIAQSYLQYDFATEIFVDVKQAFNAGADNTISLGYAGNTAALLDGLSVATPGRFYINCDHADAGAYLGLGIETEFTVAKDLVLTFNGTGAAPTTGQVKVQLRIGKSARLT